MTAYIATAAGVVFLTVIAGMIIPEGKLNKVINFVLRIACILILISPVFGFFSEDLSDGEQNLVDYDYVADVFAESQSRELERLVEQKFSIECQCSVEIVYEDGEIREKGVSIVTYNVEEQLIEEIQSYLKELGYININVNEKTS